MRKKEWRGLVLDVDHHPFLAGFYLSLCLNPIFEVMKKQEPEVK